MGALFESHFMVAVYFIQLACGLLFVSGRFVPLTLLLIGPVIFNILLYHVTMDPAGIAPGLFAAICWAIIFYRERSAFAGVFRERS